MTSSIDEGDFEDQEPIAIADLGNVHQTGEDLINQVSYIKDKCVYFDTLSDAQSKWSETSINDIQSFILESSISTLLVYKFNDEIKTALDLSIFEKNENCSKSYPLNYFVKVINSKNEDEFTEKMFFGSVNLKTSSLIGLQRKLVTCFQMNNIYSPTNAQIVKDLSFFGQLFKSCCVLNKNSIILIPSFPGNPDLLNDHLEILAFQWLHQVQESFVCETLHLDFYMTVPEEIEKYKRKIKLLEKLSHQVNPSEIELFRQELKKRNPDLEIEFDHIYHQLQNDLTDTTKLFDIIEGLKEFWFNFNSSQQEEESTAIVSSMVQYAITKTKDVLTLEWLIHKINVAVVEKCINAISTEKLCQGYIISGTKSIKDNMAFANKCQKLITSKCNLKLKGLGFICLFLRRCQQLLKLFIYVRLFGRWEDGNKLEIPITIKGNYLVNAVLKSSEIVIGEILLQLSNACRTFFDLRTQQWQQFKLTYEARLKEILNTFANAFVEDFKNTEIIDQRKELGNLLIYFSEIEEIEELNQANKYQYSEAFITL